MWDLFALKERGIPFFLLRATRTWYIIHISLKFIQNVDNSIFTKHTGQLKQETSNSVCLVSEKMPISDCVVAERKQFTCYDVIYGCLLG